MTGALALPQGLGAFGVDQMAQRLTFVGFPPKRSTKQLSGSAEEALKSVATILDQMITGVVQERTAADFTTARQQVFQGYAELVFAMGSLVRAVVPPTVIDQLTADSFCQLEADLRDHALTAFGKEVQDQAIFTVWTLRKIDDLCQRISKAPLTDGLAETDSGFAKNYRTASVWTRFHLECLVKAMILRIPIYPDVMGQIMDGLRAAVNAYAWARRGFDVRVPITVEAPSTVEWDDEDQALLDESSRDMISSA